MKTLSVENLNPSQASIRMDCMHVGLLKTLCCIERLLHDDAVLTRSFSCTGLKQKSSSRKLSLCIPNKSCQFDVVLMSALSLIYCACTMK